MKKQITIIFGLILMLTASAAYAQSHALKGNIPFDFVARGEILPAGEYTLTNDQKSAATWKISGKSIKSPMIYLLANTVENNTEIKTPKLTFRRYGNRYFLVAFTSSIYQINLPKTKQEKQLQRELMAINKSAEAEIVTIATVLQ